MSRAADTDAPLTQRALSALTCSAAGGDARTFAAGAAETSGVAARRLPARHRRPSQKERILRWTRAGRAARQRDWMNTPAPDGAPPITRLAAIIGKLERDGHRFHHRPIDGGMVEYVLALDQPLASLAATGAAPTRDVAQEQLLQPLAAPRNAILGWDGRE